MKLTTVLKWIGYLDGAAVAGAIAFGKAAPQYQPIVDSITGLLAGIGSVLGVYAHMVAGAQTVTPAQAMVRTAQQADTVPTSVRP